MLYDQRWDLDETSRHLLAAANYMEAHGWCRMAAENDDGEVCVLKALLKVCKSFDVYIKAKNRLKTVLHRDPGAWNDYVCKSKSEAVAVLRAAAMNKY